jgi:ribosomal protein S18 acetylase RimI-like enzyme
MIPGFHIRECTDADWPQAMGLIRSVFFGEGFGSAQRLEQNVRREIIEPAGTTLVAVEAGARGQVLGAVVLAHRGGPLALTAKEGEAEIRMLVVNPEARGRGVGEALVRECQNRAALPPHSAHTMVLHTQPLMVAAQRLYERLGFVRVPARDLTFGPEAQGPAGPSTRERWAYALRMVK